jgi:hypothetical protein
MNRAYIPREEVIAMFIDFQDRVRRGLSLRKNVEKDWFVQDAYDIAADIVFTTPLAPEKE